MFLLLAGQTFELHDLVVVGLLIVLEGTLSVDNALVLGLLARRLPKSQQQRALTYGLIGAFAFRLIAIGLASFLLQWTVFKLLGGGYLIYVAVKHFFFTRGEPALPTDGITAFATPGSAPVNVDENATATTTDFARLHREQAEHQTDIGQQATAALADAAAAGHAREPTSNLSYVTPSKGATFARFWPTVLVIELTDLAFAVDSIVAAIGVVGPAPTDTPAGSLHPKLWVVLLGGFFGVVLMRFAAMLFIRLLERFPRLETAAYLLVIIIGLKLVIDFTFNSKDYHPVNFHDVRSPAFWTFWILMIISFAIGFIGKKSAPPVSVST